MWYDEILKRIQRIGCPFVGAAGKRRVSMGKRVLGCLAMVLCLLGLGGCVFGSVDEMYALPKSSEAYVNLQAKINQEKGNAEYIAPLSGENCQTIQLVDVDGDGLQEAVAFFRDVTSEAPLKIVFFRQDNRGEYQVFTRIEGVGSEIESIEYLDLGGTGGTDILVSWQVSGSVHSLVGYTLNDGQPVEIMRSGYSRYLTADLDSDGQQEVILSQTESGAGTHLRIEYYDCRDGRMEMTSVVPLSEGATGVNSWNDGQLAGEVPALFVTSFCGSKDVLVTDVFCLEEGKTLKNITLQPEKRRSENTVLYSAGVQPEDIDRDGAMEVPVAQEVPFYGESSVEKFWWFRWMRYRADGTRDLAMTTYHSGDGWYLEIPESWTGDFSMSCQESATVGVRTITFALGVEGEEAAESEVKPFLQIYCLTGSDRTRQARQENRFILHADATTIYAAEFLDSDWDCGLTQETLKACFHAELDSWNTIS